MMVLKVYVGESGVAYRVPVLTPQTMEQARLDVAAISRAGLWLHESRMFFPPHTIRYIAVDEEAET